MNCSPHQSDDDRIIVVIDKYQVIVPAPKAADEAPPQSWREVAVRMNKYLMRVAVGVPRLVAFVLEGAANLISGLARVPDAVTKHIEGAHVEADIAEASKQQLVEQQSQLLVTSSLPNDARPDDEAKAALERVLQILAKYRAMGVDAYVTFAENGAPVIVCGAPSGSAEQIRRLITEELKNPKPIPD